jgi:ElaB/YqjD/DUF883 family membrane-anchored ribosome-binding protein
MKSERLVELTACSSGREVAPNTPYFFPRLRVLAGFYSPTMNEPSSPEPTFGGLPAQDPFQAAKASAMKAAEELRQAATQKAGELKAAAEAKAQQLRDAAGSVRESATQKAGEFRDAANDAWSDARGRYEDLRSEAERLTREKPMQAVLTAFGVGLFLGLILRR